MLISFLSMIIWWSSTSELLRLAMKWWARDLWEKVLTKQCCYKCFKFWNHVRCRIIVHVLWTSDINEIFGCYLLVGLEPFILFLIFKFKFIDFEKTVFKFIDFAKTEFKFKLLTLQKSNLTSNLLTTRQRIWIQNSNSILHLRHED